MKMEWKKDEKAIYLPKAKPEILNVPAMRYFVIEGRGNPNDEFFADYIAVLYSLAYAVKMSPKKGLEPEGYKEFSVYPLEGIWDLTEEGRKNKGSLDKDQLIFRLMIRQPDFVDAAYAYKTIEDVKIRKPNPLLDKAGFEIIEDGRSVQMMHLGPYDDEPTSFALMKSFCEEHQLERKSMTHREIYISDARRTAPERLKTVLRFQIL